MKRIFNHIIIKSFSMLDIEGQLCAHADEGQGGSGLSYSIMSSNSIRIEPHLIKKKIFSDPLEFVLKSSCDVKVTRFGTWGSWQGLEIMDTHCGPFLHRQKQAI
jgi:hypothetical protein